MSGDEISIDTAEGLSFREIAMMQFKKIVDLSNVEFRGGFYTQEVLSNGQTKELYVPDTRETYCNAVVALCLVAKPKFDDIMKEEYSSYFKKMKEIQDYFIEKSVPEETVILGEGFYTDEEDRILLETYKQKKLILHQKLFVSLSLLLGRRNYFTMGGVTI